MPELQQNSIPTMSPDLTQEDTNPQRRRPEGVSNQLRKAMWAPVSTEFSKLSRRESGSADHNSLGTLQQSVKKVGISTDNRQHSGKPPNQTPTSVAEPLKSLTVHTQMTSEGGPGPKGTPALIREQSQKSEKLIPPPDQVESPSTLPISVSHMDSLSRAGHQKLAADPTLKQPQQLPEEELANPGTPVSHQLNGNRQCGTVQNPPVQSSRQPLRRWKAL